MTWALQDWVVGHVEIMAETGPEAEPSRWLGRRGEAASLKEQGFW